MKDEIKEIINDLQRVADRKCYPEDILDGSIAQEWVDYITNLQEEVKYQKEAELEYNEKHTKLMNKCKKIREYLEEPNRDNFDFSKAYILNILEGKDNE